jgi:hypothetical protein
MVAWPGRPYRLGAMVSSDARSRVLVRSKVALRVMVTKPVPLAQDYHVAFDGVKW